MNESPACLLLLKPYKKVAAPAKSEDISSRLIMSNTMNFIIF
ncbi:hypothetical protein BAT_1881 [Bacillus pumilus ATCC 7061]|nr:hypothetical protein BAT_1881 [Bacillus pumilus ATCC 7061]